jgi:two-component system sensor histidine kinase RpfC
MLKKIFSKSDKNKNEKEQAKLRIIFVSLFFFHQLYTYLFGDGSQGILFFLGMLLLAVSIFYVYTYLNDSPSIKNQYFAIFLDASSVTAGMMITQSTGILFYGIYLWIIVGNGLRYSVNHLILSHILSIIGFALVICLNDYWHNDFTIASGLFLTLVFIPLYIYKLINRMNQAIQQAQEANKAKSAFIANVSHEIRTPLNGIIGANELLFNTNLNKDQQELVNAMQSSGQILLKLIENVLDFSKIESGKLTAEIVDFDLHKLINSSADMFSPQAEKKGIRLHIYVSPETSFLLSGDVQHLRQVIINLLSNAIKFTPSGKVEFKVNTISQDDYSTKLRFEVKDTGIGIEKGAQSNIFESFKQAHAGITNSYGGTGLGTTISKQLVEFMGGKIGFDSELNKGTTFWFELSFNKPIEKRTQEVRQTLHQMRVFGIGLSKEEKVEMDNNLTGWGGRFNHADSIPQLLSLLEQIPSSGQSNYIVLCRPSDIGLTAHDFSINIFSECSSKRVSLVMLDAKEYNQNDLVNIGYRYALDTPIDKALLFNTIHSVMCAEEELSDVISFIKHYERENTQKQRIKILIADDNKTNRIILAKILDRAGHEVDMVENGEEVLDRLEDKSYDLTIVDMNMPVLGGLEAFKIYNVANSGSKTIPWIILTASATIEAKKICEESGIDAFLTKPIQTHNLLETIKRLTLKNKKVLPFHANKNELKKEDITKKIILNENTIHELKLLGNGDNNFLNIVINGFISEGDQLLEIMKSSHLKSDYVSFKEAAHALKGSSGNVGAEALFHVCKEILNDDIGEIKYSAEDKLSSAIKIFNETLIILKIYLKSTPLNQNSR